MGLRNNNAMKLCLARKILAVIVLIPIVFLVMLNLHEIGHTIFARLFGDEDAGYYLYRTLGENQTCVGCNFYDTAKLSTIGNLVVVIGGLLFSQSVLWLLFHARHRVKWAKQYGYLLVTAMIVFASDLPFQVAQGLRMNIGNQTGLTNVDLADFLYLLHTEYEVPVGHGKLGLLVFALSYCLLVYASIRARPEVVDPVEQSRELR
mgnify:CR=1 FL=1